MTRRSVVSNSIIRVQSYENLVARFTVLPLVVSGEWLVDLKTGIIDGPNEPEAWRAFRDDRSLISSDDEAMDDPAGGLDARSTCDIIAHASRTHSGDV